MLCKKYKIPKEYIILDEPKKPSKFSLWDGFLWFIMCLGFLVAVMLFSDPALANSDHREGSKTIIQVETGTAQIFY